jgi:hypothetical protein
MNGDDLMWRRTALSLVWCLTLNPSNHLFAEQASASSLLLTRLQWVRFDLVLGRVHATTNRTDQSRQHATDNSQAGQREKLFVSVDQGLISLRYQSIAPTKSLHVEVVRRGDLHMRMVDHSEQKRCVVYNQPHRGRVSLEITAGEQACEKLEAASLWHLMLAHPAECREHLVPVLELLRPNWNIEQDRRDILANLMQVGPEQYTVSRTEIAELVEQLKDPRFRVRQRADRELRAQGQCALIYLDTLELEALDAEQRERVQRIRAAIASRTIDTPACVAARLSHDKSIWIALLCSDNAEARVVAKRQLAHLCQREIHFDPDADSHQRAEQIARLRSTLLRR